MNNIDIHEKIPEIKNPELIETKSMQISRLEWLCNNAEKKDIEDQCSSLNNILNQELEKKWFNFKWAFSKLENPVGRC